MSIKERIKRIPIVGDLLKRVHQVARSDRFEAQPFPGSGEYWEQRYSSGGNSGVGSYDKFAQFKAEVLNSFVEANKVSTVIEFGCGDGNQLALAKYPFYIGFDVSKTIIDVCRNRFCNDKTKIFKLMQSYSGETADLTLSLDVIFHLIEDDVYEQYMKTLFKSSCQYVIIYSSNYEDVTGHDGVRVRHREFAKWIKDNMPQWRMVRHVPNKYPFEGDYRTGSFADFFVYEKCYSTSQLS